MANRELLKLLKRARAGDSAAQLLLGKIFLNGGYGLAPSHRSAFLWLSKAAQKDSLEAQILVGSIFPPAFTQPLDNTAFISLCYQAAADAGVEQARDWLLQMSSSKKLRQSLQVYCVSFMCNYTSRQAQTRLHTCLEKCTYAV